MSNVQCSNFLAIFLSQSRSYRVVALRPEQLLPVDAVDGDVPGPDHHAVVLLAGEVPPPPHHPSMFTNRPFQLQTDPDARSEVRVTDILDGGHLLVVDTHHILPHLTKPVRYTLSSQLCTYLQVLLFHLLLELVVVADGAGLEGGLSPRSALSDRRAPGKR